MPRNIGYLTSKHTQASDEAYTPEYAVEPILEFIPKNWIIWCPFDTESSAFVKLLRKHGNKVIFTHKATGQDFFHAERERERERESTTVSSAIRLIPLKIRSLHAAMN